jgi:hypothetical protein
MGEPALLPGNPGSNRGARRDPPALAEAPEAACAGRLMAPHEPATYRHSMGKVIPFDRGERKAKIIRLVPTRARRGPLETRIGPKGVQALSWFSRRPEQQNPRVPTLVVLTNLSTARSR